MVPPQRSLIVPTDPACKSWNEEWDDLISEGRRVWTPRQERRCCCVKWLVDGHLRSPSDKSYRSYSPRNGCDGRCRRDHPCIMLQFDVNQNATIAHLSHALDPFVHFFETNVSRGQAKRLGHNTYFINDYMRRIESALCLHDGFGSHLVKVENQARELSDAAQKSELEMTETREIERRRIEDTDGINKTLFEKAALTLLNQPMIRNDLVTLQCLSKSCKFFRDEITLIAGMKMETLNLSAKVHLGGRRVDPSTRIIYKRIVKIPLEFRRCWPKESRLNGYYPNIDPCTLSWEILDVNDKREGHLVKVYWHPDKTDLDYIQSVDPNVGIELAAFPLASHTLDAKKDSSHRAFVTASRKGVMIECEAVENVRYPGPQLFPFWVKYSGAVKLVRVCVDFDVLVREHARQAIKDISEEHEHIRGERPLLQREEDYHDYLKSL